jgi:hypothetical protein
MTLRDLVDAIAREHGRKGGEPGRPTLVMPDTSPLRTALPKPTGDALEAVARQADTDEKSIVGTDTP